MRVAVRSLAIVMWELLNGLIPWKGMDIIQIIQKVGRGSSDACRHTLAFGSRTENSARLPPSLLTPVLL